MNGLAIIIAGGLGIAVVLAVRFIVIPLIDAPEGKHAESGDTGYTSWGQMPPEIAHEQPLTAPLATLPAGTARFADRPPQPGPVRYGANLRYRYDGELTADLEHDFPDVPGQPVARDDPAAAVERLSPGGMLPPPPVTRVPLPPVTGPALAVLHALAAPVRAHLDAVGQAKREAVHAEALAVFPPWEPWPGDDTLTGMRAISAEVA